MLRFLAYLAEAADFSSDDHAAVLSAIRAHWRKVSPHDINPHFILPDGTWWRHASNTHEDAAQKLGLNLEDVIRAGAIRVGYSSGIIYGIEVGTSITSQQAHVLADQLKLEDSGEPFHVDIIKPGSIYTSSDYITVDLLRPSATAILGINRRL
jgi:hypothetical protein